MHNSPGRRAAVVSVAAVLFMVAVDATAARAAPNDRVSGAGSATSEPVPAEASSKGVPEPTREALGPTISKTPQGSIDIDGGDVSSGVGQPAGAPGTPRAGDPPGSAPEANAPAAASPAAGPWLPGIDISNYQHPGGAAINWSSVATSGKRFVFVKATEGPVSCTGNHYTNPHFTADYAAAANVGMWRGAYHFARPRLPISSAADDARRFISVTGVPSGPRDLPPVLDLEQACGMSTSNLVAWAKAWLEQVRVLTGYRGIVYTGYYFWRDYAGNDTTVASAGYPLWMARYASKAEPLMGGWTSWTFWQHTSSGSVPGISGNVDLNYFNGDELALGSMVSAARGEAPSLEVERNEDGRAELVYVDGAGNLYQRWESFDGGWSAGWLRQSGIRRATIARNSDGRLEVFAVRSDGHLVHSWQTCSGCIWSGWFSMGNGFAGQALDTSHNEDGRLELVARNGYGVIVHTWQVCPVCGWTGWYSMGIAGGGAVTIGRNADGRMEMFAVNTAVIHAWQTVPNGGWSLWFALGGEADRTSNISVGGTSDGRMAVSWRGANTQSGFTVHQRSPNGGNGWTNVVALPWSGVASGPTISDGGSSTWAATCSSGNLVLSASLDLPTGAWQGGGQSSSSACRTTAWLPDSPSPFVFVLGDGVRGGIPGQATLDL